MKFFKKVIEYILVITIFSVSVSYLSRFSFISNIFENGFFLRGIQVNYKILSPISPAIYNYSKNIVNINIKTVRPFSGKLTVEFEGLSYPYVQTIDIMGSKDFNIKPVIFEKSYENLKKSEDVQIKIQITDNHNNIKFIKTDSVRFLSRYDMVWALSSGEDLSFLIASWVTPQDPEIKKLLRKSVDRLYKYPVFDKNNLKKRYVLNAISGYQCPKNVRSSDFVLSQISAIFDVMKDEYKIRYVADFANGSNDNTQIIKFPADVLREKSGLCIETVITLASACEAAGMNSIIALNDGHAILGVETYTSSKEYIFFETTDLSSSSQKAYNDGKEFFEKNKNSKDFKIIDIKDAREKNIIPLN